MGKHYNLIVIGAGPGGYPAAIRAAKAGKKTAVVEKARLGGTCLNSGCIPTKTYLHTAELLREMKKAGDMGLSLSHAAVDMKQLRAQKDEVVKELGTGIEKQFAACHIDLYRGTALLEENHVVRVTPGKPEPEDSGQEKQAEELTGEYILVAAGSEPSPLPIPGIVLPGVEDSTTMLERENLYQRLLIIGGGVIGMEFATIYNDLGCEVTVVEAMDRILPGMDKEISQNLKMIMKKRGVDIHTGASVKAIERMGDGSLSCVFVEKEKEIRVAADGILAAVGRRPCGENVFSVEMRRKMSEEPREEFSKNAAFERGRIVVDEHYETAAPGVYAVGDGIGGVLLAHVATAEGYCALAHMFEGLCDKDVSVIPSCVYTDPEIACVGMTADEAKTAGIETRTGKYIMSVNGKSLLSRQERGFVKLVADASDGRVIGAQLMCARATDMIGELSLAISKGLDMEALARVIMPHPTFCEGIGEAAENLAK